MTVPRLLGLVERMQGVYYTYVDGYGNVFTAFRGIISNKHLIFLMCQNNMTAPVLL